MCLYICVCATVCVRGGGEGGYGICNLHGALLQCFTGQFLVTYITANSDVIWVDLCFGK